jgi:hypothetical protein
MIQAFEAGPVTMPYPALKLMPTVLDLMLPPTFRHHHGFIDSHHRDGFSYYPRARRR